jgi:cyclopropane-fatty-acyl-phospholipid synthase
MGTTSNPRTPRAGNRARTVSPAATSTPPTGDASDARSIAAARAALDALFGPAATRTFAVRYWNGVVDAPDDATPRFTLVLHDEGAMRRMLMPPNELRVCEAYLRGDYDIEGDIEGAAALGEELRVRVASPAVVARVVRTLMALPAAKRVEHPQERAPDFVHHGGRHNPERDAAAVRSHYDVGNDFYKLFLDERMVYSCGYFRTSNSTLDEAQEAKLDHICRKLRLRPGDQLLDVGCGWGALVMHAVRRYGVTALGITLSYEQAALARERILEAGLEDRCTVEVRDYRHLPLVPTFDKISSVGMVEHVGTARLPEYFSHLYGLLRPRGLLLNHGIVHEAQHSRRTLGSLVAGKFWREGEFIHRYVFPDGELPPLATIIDTAETAGFETRDAESLREHYVRTLRHWIARLERAHETARTLVDEETYRTWRLYMAGSAYGFASGRLSLFQVLFAKPGEGGRVMLPPTRADLYA